MEQAFADMLYLTLNAGRETYAAPRIDRGSPPPLHDTGSLVIDKVCDTVSALRCAARLSGISEAAELSETQPVAHPVFASLFVPESLISVADDLLERDVIADPKYAGWSPGSTSLAGYAREITYWRREKQGGQPLARTWLRTSLGPSISKDFLVMRWEELLLHGLGEGWTEKQGYERVRELIGQSEYTWLDSQESFKIRHQISDLVAHIPSRRIPSFETLTSISTAMYDSDCHQKFGYIWLDLLLRLLEARMLTLLIERAGRSWNGGLTRSVVLTMIAAHLWAEKIDFKSIGGPSTAEATLDVKSQQLDAIAKFARDMDWPFADEVAAKAAEWRNEPPQCVRMPLPLWDWLNGIVLPGYMFPSVLVVSLYFMSATLQSTAGRFAMKSHDANFGILYPGKSYWHVRSIVGKVMAPLSLLRGADEKGVRCLAGWVGPCPTDSPSVVHRLGVPANITAIPPLVFTAQTEADEYARQPPPERREWSDEAEWTEPKVPATSTESVVLRKMVLSADTRGHAGDRQLRIKIIDCHFWLRQAQTDVMFRLLFNSVFLAVPPCRRDSGTRCHRIDPLDAADYVFRTLELTDLISGETYGAWDNRVITVVNATGGGAAEAYARAWCAYVGSSAVIWSKSDGRCCFKCALMTAGKQGLGMRMVIAC